jgi:hypothetical protein
MRYTASITMLLLMVAATALWASCPGGCGMATRPVVQCPVACPQPCPKPCPAPCAPACPCPAAVPAAIGAGPAAGLEGLQCPQFDPAYAQRMYEQNSVIIAVTDYGARTAKDGNLRAISREINGYATSANAKLACWFGQCAAMGTDCPRAQAIIDELSQNCACFDGVYAATLSTLLKQSNAANDLARCQGVCGQLRQQAAFLARREADWSFRLDRWVSEHGGK